MGKVLRAHHISSARDRAGTSPSLLPLKLPPTANTAKFQIPMSYL